MHFFSSTSLFIYFFFLLFFFPFYLSSYFAFLMKLEGLGLCMLFLLLTNMASYDECMYSTMLLLIILVSGGAIGLSLLTMTARSKGNVSISSML